MSAVPAEEFHTRVYSGRQPPLQADTPVHEARHGKQSGIDQKRTGDNQGDRRKELVRRRSLNRLAYHPEVGAIVVDTDARAQLGLAGPVDYDGGRQPRRKHITAKKAVMIPTASRFDQKPLRHRPAVLHIRARFPRAQAESWGVDKGDLAQNLRGAARVSAELDGNS